MGKGSVQLQTFSNQTAALLRDDIIRGRWSEFMPGRDRLASELGVNGRTVDRALVQLEKEGLLESRGPGRRRRITQRGHQAEKKLQVKLLLYEPADSMDSRMLEFRRQIELAGHDFDFASETLLSLKQNPKLVAKMIRAHPKTAWIVSGASRPVLEKISSDQSIPTFALFGSMMDLPIAGVRIEKTQALKEIIHSLADLGGHERIVLFVRTERRKPQYGLFEQIFVDELKARNIHLGAYNIPDWEETAEGLADCIDKLYQVTPPSAILVDDPTMCLPILHNLVRKSLPEAVKVSMVACEYHPSFKWCQPPIPHIHANFKLISKHVVSWVNNIARGKDDRKQRIIKAKFTGTDTNAQ